MASTSLIEMFIELKSAAKEFEDVFHNRANDNSKEEI